MGNSSVITKEPEPIELKDNGKVFGKVEKIVSREIGAKRVSLAKVTLYGPDFIHARKKTEEVYVCISGRGKILRGNKVLNFEPGDVVVVPPEISSAVKPYDSFPEVVFFSVCGPAYDPEDSYIALRGRNW